MNPSGNTTSVWMTVQPTHDFPSLTQNLECDVCIIGSGIAGLTTAYMLAEAGKKVVILEKFPQVAQGESARTTAQLVVFTDFSYHQLKRMHGDDIKLIAESHRYGLETIGRIALENGIECDYQKVPVFLFAPREKDLKTLDNEEKALQDLPLKVRRHERLPTKGLPAYPCLEVSDMAQMHPLKYLYGLAEVLAKKDVQIYVNTKADKIDEHISDAAKGDTEGVQITTENGFIIKAQYMVTATNSPVNVLLGVHLKQAAYRTYVVGLKIKKGTLPYAIWWDTLEPYHYVRLVEFEDYDVLIAGGEDHHTGREEKGGSDVESTEQGETTDRFDALETWARATFPQLEERLFAWSGQVMESVDGIGYNGRHAVNDRIFVITGDTGSGTTNATLGARLITDLIIGKENPWEKLYSPARVNLRAADELVKEGAQAFWQFTDYVTPGDVNDANEIMPHSGALIREGLKKVAVYKDLQGKTCRLSPICPHVGCIVQWNDVEKSWDCPCHGSRFDAYGKVLSGPALSDLEVVA